MLRHRCILKDPQRQAQAAKNEEWSPTKGNKIRSGCLTPAFSVVQKEGVNATSPLHFGVSPLPSAGSKKSVVVPNKRE